MLNNFDGISLIIGTRNRHQMIADCIDAIIKSKYHSLYEILVVDQSDDSETEIYINSINKLSPHIRYVKMNTKG
jgi:glycosyltransferase involved in cell wall biosynthesis